jgi:small-conductance mechanosensitive channel
MPTMTTWTSTMIAPLLAQTPKPDQIIKLAQSVERFSLTRVMMAVVIIAAGFLLSRGVRKTLDRLGEGNARRRLFMKKVTSFLRIGIFFVAAYLVVLTFFDLEKDSAALLGLGGTAAVALGFALKDVSSSLVAGILILVDQPFQVGDRVQFEETYGEVIEIGLRSVRIRTLTDDEVSIPNSRFLNEAVASANAGALDMMVAIEFHISMTEDFELAKRIIYEACTTSKYVFLEKPVRVELADEVRDIAFCTTLTAKAYVIDARYEKQFVTDVTERVKRAFARNRISYPYTREMHLGSADPSEYSVDRRNRDAAGDGGNDDETSTLIGGGVDV